MKPLVAIFAHPDDEAFGPAGTIAKFAQERDVYLICLTDGAAGENHIKAENLSKTRKQELLTSAKILGVKKVEFLDFKDGELANNLYHQIADKLQQKLEQYQPDTLITYELRGVSGHIDHIVTSFITSYLFKKLTFVKKLLYFCETSEVINKLIQSRDYFIFMPPGYDENQIDLTIDVSDFWEVKKQAMLAHQSQIEDVNWILGIKSDSPKVENFQINQKD